MVKNESDEVSKSLTNKSIFIVWKPEYLLGIPVIDEQHRGIVTTINSLHFAMQHKHGEQMLQPVIGMVNAYTKIHFDIEEEFHKGCNYPDLKQHHEMHNDLLKQLSSVGKESLYNNNPQQFLEFLKNWWIDHIREKDRLFRDYILELSR